MPTFDATSASCSVISYKEGLLAAVGHDVRLEVGRFTVEVSRDGVLGTFEADSLRVACAVRDGRDDPAALSAKDKETIVGYVRKDILESGRYPKIIFRAELPEDDGGELEFDGELQLHGARREVSVRGQQIGQHWVCKVRINQSDFGIRPFKAMMGALKIRPHVDVELRLPVAALAI
jgi:hypothetical protein